MTRTLLLVPMLSLAACATPAVDQPPAASAGGECRGEDLAQFTGRPGTAELGAEILSVSGARTIQWIGQGEMVTMEFSPDRIRVQLDASNRVEAARCG